jgi:hypothetical protein
MVEPDLKLLKTPHPVLDQLIGLTRGDARVIFFAVVVVHTPIVLGLLWRPGSRLLGTDVYFIPIVHVISSCFCIFDA